MAFGVIIGGVVAVVALVAAARDFNMPTLRAFLFLDWMAKEPFSAVDYLRSRDYIEPSQEKGSDDESHDTAALEEEL